MSPIAQPTDKPADDLALIQNKDQYFSFTSNGQEYAVDILRIREIRGWTPVRPMPGLPDFIRGVIDLRGEVVPIIDFRERLGMPTRDYDATTVVVVLQLSGDDEKLYGLVVDAVSEVYDAADVDIQPPPDMGLNSSAQFVNGLLTIGEKMVIVLDVESIFTANIPQKKQPVTEKNPSQPDASLSTSTQLADCDLIEQSFKLLVPKGNELVSQFYQQLFQQLPEARSFFENTSMVEQERKLLETLQVLVQNARQPEKLDQQLHALGQMHQNIGVEEAHYDIVTGVLLDVMRSLAGEHWNREIKQAWQAVLDHVKAVMTAAPESTDTEAGNDDDPVNILQSSFALLANQADTLVDKFYTRLFNQYPETRSMFGNADMAKQKSKLVAAIAQVIASLRQPEALSETLMELGRKHQGYGAEPEHYDAVTEVLLEVMSEMAGEAWTDRVHTTWEKALQGIRDMMLSGYQEALTKKQINLIEMNAAALDSHLDELTARFYGHLFRNHPEIKALFANVNPKEQKKKLAAGLQMIIRNLSNPKKLKYLMLSMGKRHQNYGAALQYYDPVIESLLYALEEVSGNRWTHDKQDAWEAALQVVKEMMLDGYD